MAPPTKARLGRPDLDCTERHSARMSLQADKSGQRVLDGAWPPSWVCVVEGARREAVQKGLIAVTQHSDFIIVPLARLEGRARA